MDWGGGSPKFKLFFPSRIGGQNIFRLSSAPCCKRSWVQQFQPAPFGAASVLKVSSYKNKILWNISLGLEPCRSAATAKKKTGRHFLLVIRPKWEVVLEWHPSSQNLLSLIPCSTVEIEDAYRFLLQFLLWGNEFFLNIVSRGKNVPEANFIKCRDACCIILYRG